MSLIFPSSAPTPTPTLIVLTTSTTAITSTVPAVACPYPPLTTSICPSTFTTHTTRATISARPSQTLTIYPLLPSAASASAPTPTPMIPCAPVSNIPIAVTELDIVLLCSAPAEPNVWGTLTYLTMPVTQEPWSSVPAANGYVVVPAELARGYPDVCEGAGAGGEAEGGVGGGGCKERWACWSAGQQAGLIVGVVIAGLVLLGLVWWCCMSRRIWVAAGGEDDRRARRGNRRSSVYWLAGRG